jgi:hypothetical protein
MMSIVTKAGRLALLPLLLALAACATSTNSGSPSASPDASAGATPPGYADTLAHLTGVAPQTLGGAWKSEGTDIPAATFWADVSQTSGAGLDPSTPEYAVYYSPLLVSPADADGTGVDQVIYLGEGSAPTASLALAAYARVFATADAAQAWAAQNAANHLAVTSEAPATTVTTPGGNSVAIFQGSQGVGPSAVMVTGNVIINVTLVATDAGLTQDDQLAVLDEYAAAL